MFAFKEIKSDPIHDPALTLPFEMLTKAVNTNIVNFYDLTVFYLNIF